MSKIDTAGVKDQPPEFFGEAIEDIHHQRIYIVYSVTFIEIVVLIMAIVATVTFKKPFPSPQKHRENSGISRKASAYAKAAGAKRGNFCPSGVATGSASLCALGQLRKIQVLG